MSESTLKPQTSEPSTETRSKPAQDNVDDNSPHDSDEEPMVYRKPRDYKTWAIETRERMISEGADPDSVILQSQVSTYIPRQEGESDEDYTKRYCESMNAMIRRGVSILNDMCVADQVASGFGTKGGRYFDLGPGSGVTKGEFREFSKWFHETSEKDEPHEVPEKWKRLEKPHPRHG